MNFTLNESDEIILTDFSTALRQIKDGKKLRRQGWNGKGLHVALKMPEKASDMDLPYIYIQYPTGIKCPWLASQTDLLANDWFVVD